MVTQTLSNQPPEPSRGPEPGRRAARHLHVVLPVALAGLRRIRLSAILVGLLALLLLPTASAAPRECSLRGFVIEPDLRGVPNARVRLTLSTGQSYTGTTDQDGLYQITFPLSTPTVRALLFAQVTEGQPEVVWMAGAINFRQCRQDRNVFVNANQRVTLGPVVPPGPGTTLAYPGPQAPPPEPLADAIAYLDSGVLPGGGLASGALAWLPLCVSNADLRQRQIRLDRVRYEAVFDTAQLHLFGLAPDQRAFEHVMDYGVNNVAGKLVYAAASDDPVTLPAWPACLPIAQVQVGVRPALQPGDVATLLGAQGTTIREAGTLLEGDATRSGTYIDIIEQRFMYLPIVKRRVADSP